MDNKKELPQRKDPRLKGYDYSKTGEYFLTICTQNRKNILSTIVNYVSLDRNPSPTADTIIGWLKYQTTKEINKLRGSSGEKIFQRSFFDHIVRNHDDYYEICKYIFENPARWYFDKLYSEE